MQNRKWRFEFHWKHYGEPRVDSIEVDGLFERSAFREALKQLRIKYPDAHNLRVDSYELLNCGVVL